MCSSTVSDTANRLRKTRKKKSSAVPLFRSGHMSAICARLGSKGKVGVQRGRETAGCPFLFAPAAGRGDVPAAAGGESLAEVQRKTLRPVRANPPAAVRVPRSAGAGKGAAPLGRTRLTAVRVPRSCRCRKREPPRQGEPADGSSSTPLSRCRKRSRTVRANPPAAVRVPRSTGAGKRRVQPAIKIFKKICVTLLQNTRK